MKAEPRVAAAVYYVVTVMLCRPYMPVSPTGSLATALVSYTFLVIPMILPFYFWDKTRQERIIAGSGVDWVIVRPGALTNGSKRGRLRHGSRVGSFLWTVRVSRADVAEFMLDQVASNTYLRAAPGVA